MGFNEFKVGDILRFEDDAIPHIVTKIDDKGMYLEDMLDGYELFISFNDDVAFVLLEHTEDNDEEFNGVVHPKRYNSNGIECWDFIITYHLDYFLGTACKYVWRHRYKNGAEDLDKAVQFLQKAVDSEQFPTRPDDFTYYPIVYLDLKGFDTNQLVILHNMSNMFMYDDSIKKGLYRGLIDFIKEYKEECYG